MCPAVVSRWEIELGLDSNPYLAFLFIIDDIYLTRGGYLCFASSLLDFQNFCNIRLGSESL